MKNLVLLLQCVIKICRPLLVHLRGPLEGKPLHLTNLLSRDHVPNRDPLLGTQQLLITLLLVTLTIR